jgi:phage repressor protein C with HTH and peptisase S24 domain
MGKTLADFLIEKTKDLNQVDLAKAIGVSQSFLSRLKSGQNKTADLSLAVDLSVHFQEPLEKMLALIGKERYYEKLRRSLAKEFKKEPVLNFNMPEGEIEGVKVFDSPACLGPGYDMDEARDFNYMPIPKKELPRGYKSDPNRIICLPTKGTSMVPTILPDSYIWVDRYIPAETVTPGDIYAFLLPDGTVTIKRLIRVTDHQAIIDADNQDPAERKPTGSLKEFPMILPLREDLSVVRGRVIWILNRLVEKPKK